MTPEQQLQYCRDSILKAENKENQNSYIAYASGWASALLINRSITLEVYEDFINELCSILESKIFLAKLGINIKDMPS
jgi:hypothetical protein